MYGALKLISILLALSCAHLDFRVLAPLVYGLGLVHFFITTFFTIPILKNAAHSSISKMMVALLILCTFIPLFYDRPFLTTLYIGVHFALTDAYMGLRGTALIERRSLIVSRIIFELLAFIMISFHGVWFHQHEAAWIAVLTIVFVSYLFFLWLAKATNDSWRILDLGLAQLFTFLLVITIYYVLNLYGATAFFLLILVHINMWLFYPTVRAHFSLTPAVKNQYVLHFLGALIVLPIVFYIQFNFIQGPYYVRKFFLVWTFFHVSTNFASSFANPKVIRQFFHPV